MKIITFFQKNFLFISSVLVPKQQQIGQKKEVFCFRRHRSTPLLRKDLWKNVANFLNPQNQIKVNALHKSLSCISTWQDATEKVIERMEPTKAVSWRFFENLETGKFVAQNVNRTDAYGWTALHYATLMNLPEIAESLIGSIVDVNAVNDAGYTALHYAARDGHLEIGRMLIKANAEIGAEVKSIGNWKSSRSTPLHLAARKNHLEMGRMLLDAGADVHARDRWNETPIIESCTAEFRNMLRSYKK